jgi:hypothetical protein
MNVSHSKSKKIESWPVIAVVALFVISLVAYLFQFGGPGSVFSTEQETWGQLGDYMGGLTNPLVSLAALYFLFRAFLIQKREFRATTKALTKGAAEQAKQVNAVMKSAEIGAHTARLQTSLGLKQYMANEIEHISNAFTEKRGIISFEGKRLNRDQALERIQELSKKLKTLHDVELRVLDRLDEMAPLPPKKKTDRGA